MERLKTALTSLLCVTLLLPLAQGQTIAPSAPGPAPAQANAAASLNDSEARLLEIYRLTAAGQSAQALDKAARLARDYPNFQLAQLVYGDLLLARARPIKQLGDVPDPLVSARSDALDALREESRRRVKAHTERPPGGSIPSAFVNLSDANRHAIAVDATKSRLYLFENNNQRLRLVADFYVSVGKLGTEKNVRGDLRTPVGVYFITGTLDPKQLPEFYGAGALPINYPNMLDVRRGKTGSGIWLHGTPPNQYARAPLATDGCLVLSNDDLSYLLKTVATKTTPVLITRTIDWVKPEAVGQRTRSFEHAFLAWRAAKSRRDANRALDFYAKDFSSFGKTRAQWEPQFKKELGLQPRGKLDLNNLSMLRWADHEEVMMVTFDEALDGKVVAQSKRQYWIRQGNQWKIFFEGIVG